MSLTYSFHACSQWDRVVSKFILAAEISDDTETAASSTPNGPALWTLEKVAIFRR